MDKKNSEELINANRELAFQKQEKKNRAAELVIANKEKKNRAAELVIANEELIFQNEEKENRAAELIIANKEKGNRATELGIANKEKENRAAELVIANKELIFQNLEKEKRAAELLIANKELAFQNEEKENRANELIIANKELVFQNEEKEDRAAELIVANKELAFQNEEKGNRAAELVIANKELAFQNAEKESRANELAIANKELAFQNEEKENRAAELVIANKELAFQNAEKENRANELAIANKELAFQNEEKENRAAELAIANKELAFQNAEKESRAADLIILSENLKIQQEELKTANNKLHEKASLLIKQEEKVRIINNDLLLLNQELEARVINRTQALAESEKNFRNMMETIPQIAWTNNIDGEIAFFNQRWYDYTGMDYEQSEVWGWLNAIHPEDLQGTLDQYKSIIKANKGGEFQNRKKRADGNYRWHLIRLMPIKDEIDEVRLWAGTATDIHELKLLQQQKDDFISIASHELKTPITSLKASLQLLNRIKNEPPSSMLPNMIDLANKSLDKVIVLIKYLLDASNVNEGQLRLNQKSFILSRVIEECCHSISIEAVYNIIIEGDMHLEVYADAERVNQVVINFITNAIKYAPESKDIRVRIERINNMAKISIIDKGPGIDADKLIHLFDRYYRAGSSSSSKYSGLGLGLYISAEIIKKHHGQIGVDSEIGKGSSFWFTLPTTQQAEIAY